MKNIQTYWFHYHMPCSGECGKKLTILSVKYPDRQINISLSRDGGKISENEVKSNKQMISEGYEKITKKKALDILEVVGIPYNISLLEQA
jgi:hypothetical protein